MSFIMFRILRELDDGQFSVVSHGNWKQMELLQLDIAVKFSRLTHQKKRVKFLWEADIMDLCDYPNIIMVWSLLKNQ